MNILGIHFGHEGSVAIIKNNRLVYSISSERITRKKKQYGITEKVINVALTNANLKLEDIDAIGFSDYFKEHSYDACKLYFNDAEQTSVSQIGFAADISDKFYFIINGIKIKAFFIPHHLSHHSAAFYTSGFEKSANFSLDACSRLAIHNSLFTISENNHFKKFLFPCIGVSVFYNDVCESLGVGNPLFKAGSLMGLSSYGQPNRTIIQKNNIIEKCFVSNPSMDFTDDTLNFIWNKLSNGMSKRNHLIVDKATINTAANYQYLFEEAIISFLKSTYIEGIDCLTLSGGSLLNCNINSRIIKEYKHIHLFPGAGDDGISVGAALTVLHFIYNQPREKYSNKDLMYLGSENKNPEVIDYEKIVDQIIDGKIVAWSNGRSEYGPRALGNRSILADPRNYHNREILNFCVKEREWFRPFAPSVLEENSKEWFDFNYSSPFMLFTAQVKNPKEIPAVTHVDNSSRMQTVNKNDNDHYYMLIKCFYEKTNIPMLLNTSFNDKVSPIVEFEEDALDIFYKTNLDVLVLNGKILKK
jgi:carbamoyltransferase